MPELADDDAPLDAAPPIPPNPPDPPLLDDVAPPVPPAEEADEDDDAPDDEEAPLDDEDEDDEPIPPCPEEPDELLEDVPPPDPHPANRAEAPNEAMTARRRPPFDLVIRMRSRYRISRREAAKTWGAQIAPSLRCGGARRCGSVPPIMKTSAPSADSYKALARAWAATVTVVTARAKPESLSGDTPALDGFTATAFLTVSIDPPIILVSATRTSSAFTMLRDASSFSVSLLAPGQADVAGIFAKPQAERKKLWDTVPWAEGVEGAPVVAGAAGAFSATVRQLVDAGDHVLVLGDVTAIHLGEGADSLVYHNRAYGKVTPIG